MLLQSWLVTKPMVKHQTDLINRVLGKALRYADAWQKEMGRPIDESKNSFFYFTDHLVFSGGLKGLWTSHVQDFKARFDNDQAMLAGISKWLSVCSRFRFSGLVKSRLSGNTYSVTNKRLYRIKETVKSFDTWSELYRQGNQRMNPSALNLIVLGFLRAYVSYGDNEPKGFNGVFQLDVLNRRGMMATGIGVRNGEKLPTVLY